MVRIPARFAQYFHQNAAGRGGNKLLWMPGAAGSGAQRITATPVTRYTKTISGVPISGGQVQGTVPASGTISLSVGPQGLGTVWYPAQVTLSTSKGTLDTSTALVYLGAAGTPITLVATVFSGNGTAALAIPDMSPGQYIIVEWTGATPGNTVAANIIGTQQALSA